VRLRDCSGVLIGAEFDLDLAVPVCLPARGAVGGCVLKPSTLEEEFVSAEEGEEGGALAALDLIIPRWSGRGRGAAGGVWCTRLALAMSPRNSAGDAVCRGVKEALRSIRC
jgi:hypothetical protein